MKLESVKVVFKEMEDCFEKVRSEVDEICKKIVFLVERIILMVCL